MDIHQLRIFASVFKHRSFSRAASELNLTQPTVSDHIRSLEVELRCRLFDRASRQVIPTQEAVLFHARAVEVIEKFDALKAVPAETVRELTGYVVIGASTIPATYVLPRLIATFRKSHPGILFETQVSDSRGIVDRVVAHDLLIGVVGSRREGRHLKYETFLEDELIVIASPDLTSRKNLRLAELIEYPMVMREEGSGTRMETERLLAKAGLSPSRLMTVALFGSTEAVKQAVREGMGATVLSRRAVAEELANGYLKEIRLVDAELVRHFYIVTHHKRTLPPAVKAFHEFLLSQR